MIPRPSFVVALTAVALVAAGCSGDDESGAAATSRVSTATASAGGAVVTADAATVEATASSAAVTEVPATSQADPLEPAFTGQEQRIAGFIASQFPGNSGQRRTIDLEQLVGLQFKDGIASIDDPKFGSFEFAADWLGDREPVVALEVNGEARAYPLQILMWHEIANDIVGGVPVVVTFCPLCNTALSFERTVDGVVRSFGVSGLLRRSDLIMFDRESQTLWQQITGEAIVGVEVPRRLTFLPSPIVSFAGFRSTYPNGVVMTRDTGFIRNYGRHPYAGYDEIGSGLYNEVDFGDCRLDAKERVLTVEIDGDAIAFPFSVRSEQLTLEAQSAGQPVVAFWQRATLSALDEFFIIGSANIGAAAAYSPAVDGEQLTYEARDGVIVDTQKGSSWNVLGLATDGPMAGTQLEPVVSANHCWFAWSVFQPETRIITAEGEG